ncbi:MAG: rRNA pseudouridine synthase [Bacilli bacterium]|nr:rRNA pseudouridine synthase [Bacilli bacterium]
MRIDRFLSNLKYGTRTEIQKDLKAKAVLVNREIITSPNFQVNPLIDEVVYKGEQVVYKENILIMMNKPAGYVSANKDGLHPTVFDLLDESYQRLDLKIAGRLDIDTEGLLLLTDNGNLLHHIISPHKDVYKKYYVEVQSKFDSKKLLQDFVILDGKDEPFHPAIPFVEQITETSFYLSIKEGKFHQVKRMVEYFSNKVTYLRRVGIGNIELDEELELGSFKEITEYEI